ncbi:hypothetical protein RUND412_007068 [Rhizina undulata]
MSQQFTFTYHAVDGIEIQFDITFPRPTSYFEGLKGFDRGKHKGSMTNLRKLLTCGLISSDISGNVASPATPTSLELVPALVFFHGGGLTAGNRKFVSPQFKAAILSENIAFISADYRLLCPSTGHDILEDVKILFTFISKNLNDLLAATSPSCFQRLSPSHLAVAGASAGAYPARLAAAFATPRPKALFSLYGTGGNLLSPFYLPDPREDKIYLGGCKIFMDPTPEEKLLLKPLADCPMDLSIEESQHIPGYRARLLELYCKLLQSCTYLDALTGIPGFSQVLREAEDKEAAIPEEVRVLFPQLHINAEFPATFLVHGTADKAVCFEESKYMVKQLMEKGVTHELVTAENMGHQFDEYMNSDVWDRYMGGVVPFLSAYIAIDEEEARRKI